MKALKFQSTLLQTEFAEALNYNVLKYFKTTSQSPFGNHATHFLAILLIAKYVATYLTIVLVHPSPWLVITMFAFIGIMNSLIGMQIGHSACHDAYSENKKLNNIMGYAFDFVSACSKFWKTKHNILHHTYPNVAGADDDISARPFLRMEASQKHYWFHKYQHIYCIPIYGLLYIGWVYVTDFTKFITGKIGEIDRSPIVLSRKEKFILFFSKSMHVVLFIVIPLQIYEPKVWLLGYLVMMVASGLPTAIIFQLAHVVGKTQHVELDKDGKIPCHFMVLQLRETANFCTKYKWLNWLIGGLNFQEIGRAHV